MSTSSGKFRLNCVSERGSEPIPDAEVKIFYEDQVEKPIEVLKTNSSGQTEQIDLPAPPFEYSQEPTAQRPYSEYVIEVSAEGFEPVYIEGSEVLPDVTAIQNITLIPKAETGTAETYVIPDHTLYGDYPPKIAENEIKDISETGEIVLSRVVIPEYVVVHDGPPSDTSAANYYVKYKDYIKNVASSEIYATWPESTILANILAIMSITLNRVYTEWYRSKGYNFTITSSTAYDQKWISGRNIFDTISKAVDTIFTNFLSRPGVTQPLFTQYCDGEKVTCPNWMTQWGSRTLGERGYTPIEILRNYYGDTIFINSAEEISGVPSSWPGYSLTVGSSGDKVRQMQEQLNTISKSYPLIPKVSVDGVYGNNTANAVKVFQGVFGLPQTGITDFPTWYKISEIYVGVSKIAEFV